MTYAFVRAQPSSCKLNVECVHACTCRFMSNMHMQSLCMYVLYCHHENYVLDQHAPRNLRPTAGFNANIKTRAQIM